MVRPGVRGVLQASISLSFVVLAGCASAPGVVETSQDAANVYISTYPAVPWRDVAEKLEPRLSVSPEVSKAFHAEGYQAHLVTLQVALQPKARNLPYDVYLNVSLYPPTWREAVASPRLAKPARGLPPPIMVYPLSISESTEGTKGDALATVGRVSDNSVRIRLGAQDHGTTKDQGTVKYGMLTRTHNISLVVITRSAPAAADQAPRVANLLVISETEIVPVAGGKPLPNSAWGRRPEQDLAEAVGRLVGAHGFALRPQCTPEASKNRNDWALDLLRAVERQDYRNVQQCLTYRAKGLPRNAPLPTELDADARNRLERLVGELIKIQAGARYAKMLVPLPELSAAKDLPAVKEPPPAKVDAPS